MPVFTATAAYIAASVGVSSAFGIAAINFGVRAIASYALTKLLSKRDSDVGTTGTTAPGTQMPPATDNKLPVIYGTSYVVPCLIDAMMSTDQSTMWYVLAISEKTDTGTISFDRVWWGDKELIFADVDQTKVTSWINSNDEENTNVNGNMWVYFYNNGSSSPTNTAESAITVLQNTDIPSTERWTINHTMSDAAFMIVKVKYTETASLTGMEQVTVEVSNTLTKPGSVLLDYFTNTRYGCALPLANVDTSAFTVLDTYSDDLITYTPVGGGTATQARYRINGIINTDNPCLSNLQAIVDSCDCWLQWDEANNKWSVIINRSYLDTTTYENLFQINNYNIVGGVDVTPIDLNNTYNSVEAQFHNNKTKDQADYAYSVLDMLDRSPNEPDNQLQLLLPYVNNSVQAQYLSTRRLIQSREDLFVTITTDYSGIQVQAGDVVRVAQPVYGWGPTDALPENPDKLFRISQVVEAKTEDGSLGAQLTMFEYNEDVYANIDIEDYTPASNTGIPYPGWISTPGTPTVTETTVANGQMSSLIVSATVPSTGTVLYMDFYYGTSSDASTHRLYRTVTPSTGRRFTNGVTVSITVNDLPKGTYYWSIKARGSTSIGGGQSSNSPSSSPSAWDAIKVLVPAIIAGQLLGGLAKSVMQSNVGAGSRIAVFYSPKSVGAIPVDVTTTTDRNIPLIIPYVSPTYGIFPWYEGTFPTSTGPWAPTSAATKGIVEGDEGWYIVMRWDTSTGDDIITVDEMALVNLQLNFISDTADTYIQICNYIIFEDYPTIITLQTETTIGYNIPGVDPYPFGVTITDVGSGEASIIEWGYVLRVLTPGANVQVWSAFGVLSQMPSNYQF